MDSRDPDASELESVGRNVRCKYNCHLERPQLPAMLDASALLWNAREFVNPADAHRPTEDSKHPDDIGVDDMHYWSRTFVESFLSAREIYKAEQRNMGHYWELDVKTRPQDAFPTSLIGAMCTQSWERYFPLVPARHENLRDNLRRVRALNVMWGELRSYRCDEHSANTPAWMPLSEAHRVRLLEKVGLFDAKYRVPSNPWLKHNGVGISQVYNQSYHSPYHTDSYLAPHFREWLTDACRYQPPRGGGIKGADDDCYYPFSQYGGTPVEGDFLHHRVEACDERIASEKRHRELLFNRFGLTTPLRLGQQFHDTGLLQDLYSFSYRPYADLTPEQRARTTTTLFISNFMAYARTHAIIALASNNAGTEDMAPQKVVRNLYRLYVDTHECASADPDADNVPIVMGFAPNLEMKRASVDDRPIVLYAGSLSCLNTKLSGFCASGANRGERVCHNYKQVYLNEATLLYTRLLRAERRRRLHTINFSRAQTRRGPNYARADFDRDLLELQDAYIDFLQTTMLGMLIESGADLNNVPLHLLEPRELQVSLRDEDPNLVANDFLTPRARDWAKDMDFSGDTLTRQQLAILSLIPPNNRILGTLRLNQSTEIVDLEHVKKQIQKDTIANNKKVWEKYSKALIDGNLAQRLLEVDGPIDFGFDMSAIKDPLKESEGLTTTKFTTTGNQQRSSIAQRVRDGALRTSTEKDAVGTLGAHAVRGGPPHGRGAGRARPPAQPARRA